MGSFIQVGIRASVKPQLCSPSSSEQLHFLLHPSWQDLGGPGKCRSISLCLGKEENMWAKHKETKAIDIPGRVLRLREGKKKSSDWWLLRKLHFVAQLEPSTDAEVEMQLLDLTRSEPRPLSLRSCRNLQAAARGSPPAAAICLALLQLQREGNSASLWPNTINASLQPSIAAASVEIYHISAAAWCFYSACSTAEELWVWGQSCVQCSSSGHGKRGCLSFPQPA